ncbi:MAG: hypothetical protein ACP5NV_04090 [Candidatus Woesearchaeota archaeon]
MNENTRTLLMLLLAGVLILSPYALRMFEGNPYTINSETYYNTRVSGYDELQERKMPFSILDYFNQNSVIIGKILPVLLGILSIGLCILIMKKHNISEKNTTSITLILISSPIFLYTFLDFKYYAFSLILTLLTIYLLASKTKTYAAIPLALIPFFDLYSALISAIFISMYVLLMEKKLRSYIPLLIVGVLSIIAAIIVNIYTGHDMTRIPIENPRLITDIGAEAGFSFSTIILAIIGIMLLWEKGLRNLVLYIVIIGLVVLSIYNTTLKAYINYALVVYAGFAFIYLTKRKWSIQIIKKITLLLIVCSIMFTTIFYATKLSQSAPTPEYVDALNFLKDQSIENEKVFSSQENGYIIQYYSQRAAFIDQKSNIYEPEKLKIFNNITHSRNLEKTEKMLQEHGIRYIFIDEKFKQRLESDEGLLFLIENSNKFKNIYQNERVEIWMYITQMGVYVK